jgi:trigger factor
LPRLKESSRPEAVNRLKRTMALGEIAKQEHLEVTAAELDEKVKTMLEELGGSQADIDPERLRTVLSEELLKEKILSWIEENSTIQLVPAGSLADASAATVEAAAEVLEVEAEVVEEQDSEMADQSDDLDNKEALKAKKTSDQDKSDQPKTEKSKAKADDKAEAKEEKPKKKKPDKKKKS